ncbi:MAG: Bax inhibitor-1/YccA family protein [Alphaproteobacteria bacterium]|nr:Bax inhibitor-1/YccA family protein [Alphaproteobacteria bacterium]
MTRSQAEAAQIDVGLREHMLRVYNYMASGVALTGIVAMLAASSPAFMNAVFGTPLAWVVMLAPLAFVLVLSFGIHRLSLFASQAIFWTFAAAMGLSLSTIFLVYTGESIARVFFITAIAFGSLSLWGYTTKRDISGWGSFLFMGLVGIIVAALVNLFLQSSALQFAISVIGVLVFAGLTAYDTQKIKNEYSELHDHETSGKLAVMGALRLYLDFINLMIMLLHLLGNRR